MQGCLANDGSGRTVFIPSFPATCPWVTTVGETQNINPEIAMSQSSGGFSNFFPRPAYQSKSSPSCNFRFVMQVDPWVFTVAFRAEAAVNSYLKSWGTKYASYFNREGRGFPDVAAQGSSSLLVLSFCFRLTHHLPPSVQRTHANTRVCKTNRQPDSIL